MSSPMTLRSSGPMLLSHSRTGSRPESRQKNRTGIGLSLDIYVVYHKWYTTQALRPVSLASGRSLKISLIGWNRPILLKNSIFEIQQYFICDLPQNSYRGFEEVVQYP